MKYKYLLCLIAFLIIPKIKAQEFKSAFKKFGVKEGLSQITVNKIIEDRQGFIWVATQDGLNRFDGNEFKIFRSIPKDTTSLSDNNVYDLAEDQQGNIWAATVSGGMCKYNPLTGKFTRYLYNKDSIKSRFGDKTARTIHIDAKNRIWVGHPKGLAVYNEKQNTFEKVHLKHEATKNTSVFDLDSDKEGNLWVGTANGMFLVNTSTLKVVKAITNKTSDSTIGPGQVIRLIVDQAGLVWILQPNYTISCVDTKKGSVKKYFNDSSKKNPHPRYIYESKAGDIWLATEFKGIVKLNKKTGEIQPPYDETMVVPDLLDYHSITLFEDSAGSFWAGSWGQGLLHYNSGANPFGYRPNISDANYDLRTDSFRNIFEDNYGLLWISTVREGLVRLDPKTGAKETFENIKTYLNIDKLAVQEILQDQNNTIWIGTRGNGMIRINPETLAFKVYFNKIDAKNNINSNSFHIILETKDGNLWLMSVGAISRFNPETEELKVYPYNPKIENSLPGPVAMEFYEDFDNNIWVSFYKGGFYHFDRKKETFTEISLNLSNNENEQNLGFVTYAFQNKKNIVWLGSTTGLIRYNIKTKESKTFTTENGLANNTIYDILDDDSENLWISTNDGISKFNPKTEVFKNYSDQDGLNQSEFNIKSAHKSKISGLFYFGGAQGFNYFDPKEIKKNNTIPPIVITDFKKYNSDKGFISVAGINYKNKINLNYNEKDFTIKVAALNFTNPSKNQFAYILEGYNNKWVEIGTKREISFTNLSPGNYTLKIKGANNNNVWNEQGKSLQISISPPWWGPWWSPIFGPGEICSCWIKSFPVSKD